MTLRQLESRVASLEADVAQLKGVEEVEIDMAVNRSQKEFDRGEGIPVRKALEKLRRKHNIRRA